MEHSWKSSPAECEIGDWCFGPKGPPAWMAIVEIAEGKRYMFRHVLWKSDSCPYAIRVWRRVA